MSLTLWTSLEHTRGRRSLAFFRDMTAQPLFANDADQALTSPTSSVQNVPILPSTSIIPTPNQTRTITSTDLPALTTQR